MTQIICVPVRFPISDRDPSNGGKTKLTTGSDLVARCARGFAFDLELVRDAHPAVGDELLAAVHRAARVPRVVRREEHVRPPGLRPRAFRSRCALRSQVPIVLAAMEAAIKEEEAASRAAKDEKERVRREEDKQIKTKLFRMGACPGGYGWHRARGGFECNGGVRP